ncbi:TRAP transporter substrate-binding protein [Glaciimonas sp. PCH181]|uniref:TRAP transporter substrate-binding protein n=1 Tax=Glaciimonas sp. PCH181 TaxID=2133943 RepID=UPI000D39068E|nr:TRAP transporter substrate-binding protein [Glaciimonas sp. PCH181]PUA16515.1 ABC transporter substrate-binding protein [Glaciimonas sp. PCH181]
MKHDDSLGQQGHARRKILAYGAVLPLSAMIGKYAHAAEFNYKMATGQDPTHPVNKRAQDAINRIKEASGGRVDIRLFPANQLGSDTDLLAQVRNGGVEFFNLASSILATLVPASGIVNTGFAFNSYAQVWKAVDGPLGKYIRSEIEKFGIVTVSRSWDNGFRQLTSSTRAIHTPEDLRGFKMRVPPAPILTSLFQALGAGPTPINFNEVYSALQTKLVEGQENPLPIIATARLYEVQKYCSMTSHVWDGYWILGNRRAMEKLPADMQVIVRREFDRSALDQRADIAKLNDTLRQDMTGKGLQFVDVDKNAFRDALRKSSFYKDWKAKFGEQGWNLLQQEVGALA